MFRRCVEHNQSKRSCSQQRSCTAMVRSELPARQLRVNCHDDSHMAATGLTIGSWRCCLASIQCQRAVALAPQSRDHLRRAKYEPTVLTILIALIGLIAPTVYADCIHCAHYTDCTHCAHCTYCVAILIALTVLIALTALAALTELNFQNSVASAQQ